MKATVHFCVYGSGYTHVAECKTLPEAIRTAEIVYAALHAVLCPGRVEPPQYLSEIKRPHCTGVTAEPRNRAFHVAIRK